MMLRQQQSLSLASVPLSFSVALLATNSSLRLCCWAVFLGCLAVSCTVVDAVASRNRHTRTTVLPCVLNTWAYNLCGNDRQYYKRYSAGDGRTIMIMIIGASPTLVGTIEILSICIYIYMYVTGRTSFRIYFLLILRFVKLLPWRPLPSTYAYRTAATQSGCYLEKNEASRWTVPRV